MASAQHNPLHDLHRQAEAEFTAWGDVEIVHTFGEPQAEYAALRKSVGMIDLPQRGILELSGEDRLTFLNNLLTAQIWEKETKQPMPTGRWTYSFLLNLKGRIVADMNVIELGDRTLIETDRRLVDPLRRLFDAYLFAEKVTMEDRSELLHEVALHGPSAVGLLNLVATDASPWLTASSSGADQQEPEKNHGLASVATTGSQSCALVRMLGFDVVAWRDDVIGCSGIHLILPVESARAIWMHLITTYAQATDPGKRRLRPVGWAAFNATRIEAGRPVFGIDFDGAPIGSAYPAKQQRDQAQSAAETGPGMLPAETGQMARAVSLTKCYLGQEVVARMHARQQVARKIVGIRMSDDALPLAGTEVLDADDNPVGIITSSTNSPVLSNTAIALATVKKPFFEAGRALRVPAEGAVRDAQVVELPFISPASA